MITKHFGSVAANTLKNMDIEKLPMLVLIQKLRGSMEIYQVRSSSSETYNCFDDRSLEILMTIESLILVKIVD